MDLNTAATAAAASAGDDQIRCALRAVGTFPPAAVAQGVAPAGAPAPLEYRANAKPAQGSDGFNVPSLFGLAVGAPYFHAGNALTLEASFDDAFAAHHQSVNRSFLLTKDADAAKAQQDLIEFCSPSTRTPRPSQCRQNTTSAATGEPRHTSIGAEVRRLVAVPAAPVVALVAPTGDLAI